MRKTNRNLLKTVAFIMAMGVCCANTGMVYHEIPQSSLTVEAAETGSRILVDLNKNDGRKASYAKNAVNWIIDNDTSISKTVNGVTFTLTASGGSLRAENNKKLQKQSGEYSYLTMDGATVDTDNGGTLTLTISGLSNGTHSLKTYHSVTGNQSVSGITVSASGGTSMSGISCPSQVTHPDDAGLGYVTFTGTSTTVTIKASSGNAWLNAFELDGGDPVNGVNHVYPADQEAHLEADKGLSWKAGKNAKSHDVYIGMDYNEVFNATTSSAAFKGNQSGTTYALDETYVSAFTYYWRVDTIDNSGNVIKGSVNSFNVARLAFPTAEGYGRYARGGQGGAVIHVTNLNDSGEGSLRWALCDAQWQTADWRGVPRIVVFDVGGVISLKSTLCIPDNAGSVYIAGQTAPGDGITLINYDFGAMGSTDVVIRDVRVRIGDVSGASCGGMGLASCNYSIVDHCSISWATDEGFSSRNAANITFQWNIIGESLHDSVHYLDSDRTQTEPHSFAASIGGYTGSFHHNLLIDCTGRNWSLAGAMEQDAVTYGGQVDVRNNVVYNWRDRTTDGGVRRLNFVNNYYKAGAVSNTGLHVVSIDGNELSTGDMQKMYVSGNVMTKTDGSYILKASDDAWAAGKAVTAGKGGATVNDVRSNSPFFESYVNTETAENAYKSVIANVGAGGTSATGRDYIDSRYITEVTNGTYTYTGSKQGLKGIIDSQNDAGGYPNSSKFAHSNDGVCNSTNDTDRDGMPNAWEEAKGLNPNDASDGALINLSDEGYTNVEMFLNELAGDPVVYGTGISTGTPAVIDEAYKYTITNSNSGLPLAVTDAADGSDVVQSAAGFIGWTVQAAEDGYYAICSEAADGKTYFLSVADGSASNGANIQVTAGAVTDAELFRFVKNADGTYTICSKVSDAASCLGVTGGSKDEGVSVIQWQKDNSANQKWILAIKYDPLAGELIESLEVQDTSMYTLWNIDTALEVGDLVFCDRDVVYITVPDALLGAELVQTPCDAKAATTDQAVITAAKDITLYVILDHRVDPVPAWLSGWDLTDMTMTNSKDVTFDLYALDVDAGETVTIGGNGQSSGCVNYGLAAAARTTGEDPAVTNYGDVDCNGTVAVADVILLNRFIGEDTAVTVTAQGLLNADCAYDGAQTPEDSTLILKYLAAMITYEELGPQS